MIFIPYDIVIGALCHDSSIRKREPARVNRTNTIETPSLYYVRKLRYGLQLVRYSHQHTDKPTCPFHVPNITQLHPTKQPHQASQLNNSGVHSDTILHKPTLYGQSPRPTTYPASFSTTTRPQPTSTRPSLYIATRNYSSPISTSRKLVFLVSCAISYISTDSRVTYYCTKIYVRYRSKNVFFSRRLQSLP